MGFPGSAVVKNPPANAGDHETWVWALGREDLLEKEMATHSSILAGIIPWTEGPGGYGPRDQKELDRTEHTHIVKLNSFKQQTALNCLTLERMHLTTIISSCSSGSLTLPFGERPNQHFLLPWNKYN